VIGYWGKREFETNQQDTTVMMDPPPVDTEQSMNDLLKSREESSDGGAKAGLLRLGRHYKSQALAFPAATFSTLLGFVIVAAGTTALGAVSGTSIPFALIALPYLGIVALLTVSTAITLSKYSIDWKELREQLGGEFRTGTGDRWSAAQLAFLLTSGMGFLTTVALLVGISVWWLVGIVHPVAGLIVAVLASAGVYLFEEWMISQYGYSITMAGVRYGEHALVALSRPSGRARIEMKAVRLVAQSVVLITLGSASTAG
jgi:hypothetical protein